MVEEWWEGRVPRDTFAESGKYRTYGNFGAGGGVLGCREAYSRRRADHKRTVSHELRKSQGKSDSQKQSQKRGPIALSFRRKTVFIVSEGRLYGGN
jgi:hypothetical protein